MARRNKVVIVMTSNEVIDEEAVKEYSEEVALAEQEEAIRDMLEEYSVFDDFNVELTVSIEEEEA